MKLGEFRTATKDKENKLNIKLSIYDVIVCSDNGYVNLEIDMITDKNIFFRVVE